MKKPDAPVEEESTLDKIVGATAAKSLATGNRALMTEDMALQLAPGAFKKNVDEIVALIKHGADVKAVNASGESAFFLAVDHARSAETITTLANAGADTSLADKSGTTPLMLAAAGMIPIWCWRCRPPGWRWISRTVKDSRRCRWRRVRGACGDRGAGAARRKGGPAFRQRPQPADAGGQNE
jgi:hypothetical protein